jgi:hypothetical protein
MFQLITLFTFKQFLLHWKYRFVHKIALDYNFQQFKSNGTNNKKTLAILSAKQFSDGFIPQASFNSFGYKKTYSKQITKPSQVYETYSI